MPKSPKARTLARRFLAATFGAGMLTACGSEVFFVGPPLSTSDTDGDTANTISESTSISGTNSLSDSSHSLDGMACGGQRIYCAGVCVDTRKSTEHCGGCYITCTQGLECHQSTCGAKCNEGCDANTEVCQQGICDCRPGLTRCGTSCVDLNSDPNNCERCGAMCEMWCIDGACSLDACEAPRRECSGQCVDPSSHPQHCGECDRVCSEAEVCIAGKCVEGAILSMCNACPCDECPDTCCNSNFLGLAVCPDEPTGCTQ